MQLKIITAENEKQKKACTYFNMLQVFIMNIIISTLFVYECYLKYDSVKVKFFLFYNMKFKYVEILIIFNEICIT